MPDFLDKVKEGLDRSVTVVGIKSKELLDAARLSGQIGRLADRKRETLAELGSLVYAAFLQGAEGLPAEVGEKCAAVAALDAEIEAKEDELREVHREAKRNLGIPLCQSCGQDLAEEDLYCRKCGAKVE